MKSASTRVAAPLPRILDFRHPEQAAKLSEAFARERDAIRSTLAELETVRYVDQPAREATALAAMIPLPGRDVMNRAPREILRMRASLLLITCHVHRRN